MQNAKQTILAFHYWFLISDYWFIHLHWGRVTTASASPYKCSHRSKSNGSRTKLGQKLPKKENSSLIVRTLRKNVIVHDARLRPSVMVNSGKMMWWNCIRDGYAAVSTVGWFLEALHIGKENLKITGITRANDNFSSSSFSTNNFFFQIFAFSPLIIRVSRIC